VNAAVNRLRVAIIGFGRLGRACAMALQDNHDLTLAGVVRRVPAPLPRPFQQVPVAGHVRELENPQVALLCVPTDMVLGVAREILQQRLPLVECAMLAGDALAAHHSALGEAARNHRVVSVVGAGWDPGALPLLRRLFETLIPRGRNETGIHPGVNLHHTAAVEQLDGVAAALACERHGADGRRQHYVYVQLRDGASIAEIERALAADALYAGEETFVFAVPDLAAVDAAGSGVVLERLGTGTQGAHQSLLLEARFDVAAFAARVMLDAARRIPQLRPGAHLYSLGQ
jgi:diaminopimelate dehydrogenase